MKLYHYVTKPNTVLSAGLLSFAANPNADLHYYCGRSGATTHTGIVQWMENCFKGRSRGIRAFSEPIQWTEESLSLKNFIDNADMFAIDLEALNNDGLLEAVYLSPSVMDIPNVTDNGKFDEILQKLPDLSHIDYTPIDWQICNDKAGRRFAFVRYYLIVVKNGVIPPKYLTCIHSEDIMKM